MLLVCVCVLGVPKSGRAGSPAWLWETSFVGNPYDFHETSKGIALSFHNRAPQSHLSDALIDIDLFHNKMHDFRRDLLFGTFEVYHCTGREP